MSPPSRSSASWERVLAAVEADAARAAALLISDDASASAGIEYDKYDATPAMAGSGGETTGVPATWRLPVPANGSAAGGPGLTGGAAARAVAGYAAASGSTPLAGTTPSKQARRGHGGGPNEIQDRVLGAEQGSAPGTGRIPAAHGESAVPATGPSTIPSTASSAGTSRPGTAGPSAEQTADIASVRLPDPSEMPPMTPEQQERFTALHTRITELQGQLAAAMAEAESVLARPPARRPDPQPRPELVDRRL